MASLLDDFLQYGSGSSPGTLAPAAAAVPDAGQNSLLDDFLAYGSGSNYSQATPLAQGADPNNTVSFAPLNDDNTPDAQATQQGQRAAPGIDGGTGAGVWGLLPQSVQHGTLRDVLGALGDAFLAHAGEKPMYQERADSRRIGLAMADYANNPQAAIERVAATGAPGSIEMADRLEQSIQSTKLRQAMGEQTAAYRQSRSESTAAYRQSLAQARTEGIVIRMYNTAAALAQTAKNPADYASIYSRLNAMVKHIDPSLDPTTAWGLPGVEDWKPGMTDTAGMTGAQISHAQLSRESIAERREANIRSTNTSRYNHDHPHFAPSMAQVTLALQAKQDRGEPLTPAEQALWKKATTTSKGGGVSLHLAGQGGGQQFTHTATDAHGHRVGWNGKQWVPVK